MNIQQAEQLNKRIDLTQEAYDRCVMNGSITMAFVWAKKQEHLLDIRESFTDGDKRGAR